uniref:Uncharacterized protein n=1 Tax=Salarias fasciatus TaxID=181472 RepID=A0A672GL16_SALFA
MLKCLKCQMKRPDLQKQALYTIRSICENKVMLHFFMFCKLPVPYVCLFFHFRGKHGSAERNGRCVYCKNYLCKKETFADLADCLRKQDVRLTHKRVSVFLLFVLVANNKAGQTLAQTTGCLAVLLDLFRYIGLRLSTNAAEVHQLWQSASCALCGCINNPQNEDGQRVCVAVFPEIKIWLQQIDLPHTEIFQPLCSFIAMAVSNNSCVQESFSACGGLETLTRALTRVASAAQSSLLSCQLSAMISKTLSACITDNCAYCSRSKYSQIKQLLSLLESPHLDPEDRLSVLLSLGSCTEHQLQLLQCGGLPVIITLLTDDTNEEIKRAATFILQTCKQASKSKQFCHPVFFFLSGCHLNPLNLSFFSSIFLFHDKKQLSSLCLLGCVLPFEEVTSRNFASILSSCCHRCDMHKVLQEATERFRVQHCKLLFRNERQYDNLDEKEAEELHLRGGALPAERSEAVRRLLDLLWSYPFQPGRTNVDLAMKYRRLRGPSKLGASG